MKLFLSIFIIIILISSVNAQVVYNQQPSQGTNRLTTTNIINAFNVTLYNSTYNMWAYNQTSPLLNQLYWNLSGGSLIPFANNVNLTFNNSQFFCNTNTGNCGIGTTSAGKKLTVLGSASIGTNDVTDSLGSKLFLQDSSVASYLGIAQGANTFFYAGAEATTGVVGTLNNFPLTFRTNNAPVMTMLSGGNIGINNVGALGKLDINQSSAFTASSLADTTSTYAALRLRPRSTTTSSLGFIATGVETFGIQGVNTAGTIARDIHLQPFGGNVGIGTTTPSRLLTISNTAGSSISNILSKNTSSAILAFGDPEDDDIASITFNNVDNSLNFRADTASERLTIANSGNVGIGTTSPSEKLNVNGNTNITGNITIQGTQFKVSNSSTSAITNRCTLSSGACTISNTAVTANTNIFCMEQANAGTLGSLYISGRAAGIQYNVSSTSVADTSVVACILVEPLGGA